MHCRPDPSTGRALGGAGPAPPTALCPAASGELSVLSPLLRGPCRRPAPSTQPFTFLGLVSSSNLAPHVEEEENLPR